MAKFIIQVYQSENPEAKGGKWHWRAVAQNGNTVADGAEGYHNKLDAENEINHIADWFKKEFDPKSSIVEK